MKAGGKGGANTNRTGLAFERNTCMREALHATDLFTIRCNDVYIDNELVATILSGHELEKWLKGHYGVEMSNVLSHRLRPDEAIYVYRTNTLHVFEKKWQQTSGSVDEKIQTGPYKKAQYAKLGRAAGIKTAFYYIFNDFWKDARYDDPRDYLTKHGISYYYNHVPVEVLGLKRRTALQRLLAA